MYRTAACGISVYVWREMSVGCESVQCVDVCGICVVYSDSECGVCRTAACGTSVCVCVCVCVCLCVWQENPLGRESVQCVDVCGESQCVVNVGIQDYCLWNISVSVERDVVRT